MLPGSDRREQQPSHPQPLHQQPHGRQRSIPPVQPGEWVITTDQTGVEQRNEQHFLLDDGRGNTETLTLTGENRLPPLMVPCGPPTEVELAARRVADRAKGYLHITCELRNEEYRDPWNIELRGSGGVISYDGIDVMESISIPPDVADRNQHATKRVYQKLFRMYGAGERIPPRFLFALEGPDVNIEEITSDGEMESRLQDYEDTSQALVGEGRVVN